MHLGRRRLNPSSVFYETAGNHRIALDCDIALRRDKSERIGREKWFGNTACDVTASCRKSGGPVHRKPDREQVAVEKSVRKLKLKLTFSNLYLEKLIAVKI